MNEQIKPLTGIAPYLGGKRNLAKHISDRVDAIPHTCYAEPFVGMGGVFFRRTSRSKSEVLNDYNGEVSNLFRVLQRHYVELIRCLRWTLTSRSTFSQFSAVPPASLTDIERAARFFYLQKTAFGGKITGQCFGVDVTGPARFNIRKVKKSLIKLHERLSDVVIENLEFEAFIRRYDKPGTLFYLDPPYFGCEDDYGKNMFSRDDFDRLATALRAIKGRFILSLNDKPEVRQIFADFNFEEVTTTYTIKKTGTSKAKELLITN